MTLLSIIVAVAIVGIVLWAINSFVPMEAKVKRLLNVVVICLLVIWLLQGFGLLDFLDQVRVGRRR